MVIIIVIVPIVIIIVIVPVRKVLYFKLLLVYIPLFGTKHLH